MLNPALCRPRYGSDHRKAALYIGDPEVLDYVTRERGDSRQRGFDLSGLLLSRGAATCTPAKGQPQVVEVLIIDRMRRVSTYPIVAHPIHQSPDIPLQ